MNDTCTPLLTAALFAKKQQKQHKYPSLDKMDKQNAVLHTHNGILFCQK